MKSKSVHANSNSHSKESGSPDIKLFFPEEFDPKFFKFSQALQNMSSEGIGTP